MTRRRDIWVFAGPSLPPANRPASDRFDWRPPAMAGDGFAALEAAPDAVVLIDGFFDHYPAIRHKELMALMTAGVPVYGAASMGALRAAELHVFGMIGVGAIFEAYATRRLVGDDEVAVLHGPAEMDWAPLTTPLVNVRATLQRAAHDRVIGVDTARRLRRRAQQIFFQDRTWRVLLEQAAARADGDAAELDRLGDWLPGSAVDLKQRDALKCLAVAAAPSGSRAEVSITREDTVFTEALAAQVRSGSRPDPASF